MDGKAFLGVLGLCLLVAGGPATGAEPPDLLAGGNPAWRVRAAKGRSASVGIAGNGFTVAAPAPGTALADHYTLRIGRNIVLAEGVLHALLFDTDSETGETAVVSYRTDGKKPANLNCYLPVAIPRGRQRHCVLFSPASPADAGEATVLEVQAGKIRGRVAFSGFGLFETDALPLPAFKGDWTAFVDVADDPADFSRIPETLRGVKSEKAEKRRFPAGDEGTMNFGGKGANRRKAVAFTEFESADGAAVRLGLGADWWMEVYLNGERVFDTLVSGNLASPVNRDSHTLCLRPRIGRNVLAVKVLSGTNGWRLVWGRPSPGIVIRESDEWKALDLSALAVREGSVLDFSDLNDAPAGKHGRAVVGDDGLLVFENRREHPVRFKGFNAKSGILGNFWSSEDDEAVFRRRAREYAQAARRQGYNLMRTHYLDQWLAKDAAGDPAINPKYLDRLDYLIREFKREGIYLHLVVFSFGLYHPDRDKAFNNRDALKLLFNLGDESLRDRFRFAAETLMGHVNPYTGLAWKDDPVFAAVEFYNEAYLGIARIDKVRQTDPDAYGRVMNVWRDWLRRRWAAQPEKRWPAPLREKGIDAAPAPTPGRGVLGEEAAHFYREHVAESLRWCERTVRAAGYPGLVLSSADHPLYHVAATAEVARIMDKHSYFAHPTRFMEPGSRIRQDSLVGNDAVNVRELALGRVWGRPMSVGEYNHAFWNPFQHEGGLAFAGYAAFQDFSMLTVYSTPVQPWPDPAAAPTCFTVRESGVLRANELLSTSLFLRRDLRPAKHRVALRISRDHLERGGTSGRALSAEQGKIALVTGFGLALPEPAATEGRGRVMDWNVSPSGSDAVESHDFFTRTVAGKAEFDWDGFIRGMRRKNLLPAGNLTDPAERVYQSDTGEITLRAKENLLKIVTPRTEAVTLKAGAAETLGSLRIDRSSVDACVGIVSMDGEPVASSRRLVLVFSTEMMRDGMRFSADRVQLRALGRAPALMRTGRLGAALENEHAEKMALYPLRLDGLRRAGIPLAATPGRATFDVDTAALPDGPTPFFELTAEK